ncbi:hypothetical protein F4778DRAFT_742480 [Xylariomycetidae sp. FL2044]|nr:hypothetical protein F4778DRAFT_742480 [Xylariomycetidae sp. FL2044]
MSSFARTYLPIGLAVGFGIWNGYYTFAPEFKEQQRKREEREKKEKPPATRPGEVSKPTHPSDPNMMDTKDQSKDRTSSP